MHLIIELNGGSWAVNIDEDCTFNLKLLLIFPGVTCLNNGMIIADVMDNRANIGSNGTIFAGSFVGNGSTYGISPESNLPDDITICEWVWAGASSNDWTVQGNWWYRGAVSASAPPNDVPQSHDDVVIRGTDL